AVPARRAGIPRLPEGNATAVPDAVAGSARAAAVSVPGSCGMTTATLIVEVVAEELPPKALKKLGESFAETLGAGLGARDFVASGAKVSAYATPRRLAVLVTQVQSVAPDAEVVDKLMPAKVAFGPDGEPTEALKKKLAALGRGHLATRAAEASDGPDRRYTGSDGKADYVYLRSL